MAGVGEGCSHLSGRVIISHIGVTSSNCASLKHLLAAHVVTMDKLPRPSELQPTGNVSDNWAKFRQKFEIYLEATSSAGKAERESEDVPFALTCHEEEALEVYNTFMWDIHDVMGQVIAK